MSDGHSRLACLAKRIEAELRQEYRADTPCQRRELRQAARRRAHAERILDTMGTDPTSTRRAWTGYRAAADRVLAGLEHLPTSTRQRKPSPADLTERLRAGGRG